MGWVSLESAKLDSFSSASLFVAQATPASVSVTLFVNPAEIFVAQISLTEVVFAGAYNGANAFISGITLQNGDIIDFLNKPTDIEWAWTQSVTFALVRLSDYTAATALATVTTYTV